jgi:hypothetical protein
MTNLSINVGLLHRRDPRKPSQSALATANAANRVASVIAKLTRHDEVAAGLLMAPR